MCSNCEWSSNQNLGVKYLWSGAFLISRQHYEVQNQRDHDHTSLFDIYTREEAHGSGLLYRIAAKFMLVNKVLGCQILTRVESDA